MIGRGRIRMLALALGAMLAAGAMHASLASAFVYWENGGKSSIERANLDGSGVNHGLITGINTAGGLAVDAAHVYWASAPQFAPFGSQPTAPPTIGRANLDGSGVNKSFITFGQDSSGRFRQPLGVA